MCRLTILLTNNILQIPWFHFEDIANFCCDYVTDHTKLLKIRYVWFLMGASSSLIRKYSVLDKRGILIMFSQDTLAKGKAFLPILLTEALHRNSFVRFISIYANYPLNGVTGKTYIFHTLVNCFIFINYNNSMLFSFRPCSYIWERMLFSQLLRNTNEHCYVRNCSAYLKIIECC